MTMNFLIAPDFPPENFGGWHLLNTVLQKRTGLSCHLLMPQDTPEQSQYLEKDEVSLMYASPFNAVELIRDRGFVPFARPIGDSTEVVIAASSEAGIHNVEDLGEDDLIALTNNDDVKLIGLRLLEPADLTEDMVEWINADSYQAVARLLFQQRAKAGLFLASAYHSFGKLTKSRLEVLVESSLKDISHVLVAHPRVPKEDVEKISQVLTSLGQDPKDEHVLADLGLPKGFERVNQEDAEFMIDLMETLKD